MIVSNYLRIWEITNDKGGIVDEKGLSMTFWHRYTDCQMQLVTSSVGPGLNLNEKNLKNFSVSMSNNLRFYQIFAVIRRFIAMLS